MTARRILIGEITTVHGIKGYVKVKSYVEDESLLERPSLFTDESASKTLSLTLKNPIKGDWIAQVEGIADRTQAEKLRGTKLYLDRADMPDPDEGEYYIEDLKGLSVVGDDGQAFGALLDVVNYGAGDLVNIKPSTGAEFYVPYTNDTIINVDLKNGTITMRLPENL